MANQILDQRGGSIKSLNLNQRFFQIKKKKLGNQDQSFSWTTLVLTFGIQDVMKLN
jgi:hypothetical protein